MTLSVVVVTYNSSRVIGSCIRSVRASLPDAEVVVVDNVSTDNTVAVCEALGGVNVVRSSLNVGYGRGCNHGLAVAAGSHVLFLNPDVEITGVDTAELERECNSSPFGLVAPPLADGGTRPGATDEHWVVDLLRHVTGPLRPRELPPLRRRDSRRKGWWPTGAMLLVDREEFGYVGGFDDRFFLFYEDIDLVRRYRNAGLPVRITGSIRARHGHGNSSSGERSVSTVRQGWWYLSWIQYLCQWNGRSTAVRAAKAASALRRPMDRVLAALERSGPVSSRAARKRRELAEVEEFVRWQCGFGDGTAADDFCPQAREILAGLSGEAWAGRNGAGGR